MSAPLRVSSRAVPTLGEAEVDALYELFARYYDGADPARFRADLSDKQHVILLREPESGAVMGFSTVRVLEPAEAGGRHRILYSGDTVVDRAYWGSKALQTGFTRLLVRLRYTSPGLPLYWLLTTKGYKTYLLLTNYFPCAWPRHDAPTPPDVAALQRTIGRLRYGDRYDADRMIVAHEGARDRLRDGVCDIGPEELENPHIRHFAELNPGHTGGDELLCLARIRLRDPVRIAAKLLGRRLTRRP